MESMIWFVLAYFLVGLVLPIAWIPRAVFLKRVTWSGMSVNLFKSVLPEGKGACAMWAYGAKCVILDAYWVDRANVDEISHVLRHECGHLVMGHARTNCLLCASGLWFLLPLFRAKHEYEAEAFAAMCRDERVIS